MECPRCHKTFAHRSGLYRHLNGSEKYKLKPCKGTDNTENDKPRSVHQPAECPGCYKVYTNQSNLTRHINGSVRHGLKPCTSIATKNAVPQVTLLAHDATSQKGFNKTPFVSVDTMKEIFADHRITNQVCLFQSVSTSR